MPPSRVSLAATNLAVVALSWSKHCLMLPAAGVFSCQPLAVDATALLASNLFKSRMLESLWLTPKELAKVLQEPRPPLHQLRLRVTPAKTSKAIISNPIYFKSELHFLQLPLDALEPLPSLLQASRLWPAAQALINDQGEIHLLLDHQALALHFEAF